MNTKPFIFFAAALGISVVAGCSRETTSSANIRTEGIAATIDVTASTSTTSTVHVALNVGGPDGTYVLLENGDQLTATAGGKTLPLTADAPGEYTADFATAAGGTEFVVAFERTVDTDALASRGTLPSPFEISGVPSNSPSRTGDDVTLTWSAADKGSIMEISIDGTCVFTKKLQTAGDAGTFTITKGTLESNSSSMPQECSVDVTMSLSASGTVDSVFDSESTFTLSQVRASKFISKP